MENKQHDSRLLYTLCIQDMNKEENIPVGKNDLIFSQVLHKFLLTTNCVLEVFFFAYYLACFKGEENLVWQENLE